MVDRVSSVRIAVLNLMPFKEVTEGDFLRLLEALSMPVEVSWMRLRSHISKHTSAAYIDAHYRYFDELRQEHFDGFIVTGAPVELIDFEAVDYWEELRQIFDWAHVYVKSTIYVCWGAQAGLYHFFGVPKYALPRKTFGVFEQRILSSVPLFDGFPAHFPMPHSRHTEIRRGDLEQHPDLEILAESPTSGVSMVMTADAREVFITGHLEYASHTLDEEYHRDLGKRDDVDMPKNYYEADDPSRKPVYNWHEWALRLYENWISHYLANSRKHA